MTVPQIDVAACRQRQQRLLGVMEHLRLDWVFVAQIEHVQYLTGPRFPSTYTPWAALRHDGHCVLVGPERRIPEGVAADAVRTYPAQWHSTLRNDQRHAATEVLHDLLGLAPVGQRIGVEFSQFCRHLTWQAE